MPRSTTRTTVAEVTTVLMKNPKATHKEVLAALGKNVAPATLTRARKMLNGVVGEANGNGADPYTLLKKRHAELVKDLMRRVMIELEV